MMDSMRPLSWRISTTCLFLRDGDGAGFGSSDGEAVEAQEARDRKKVLEEVEVERRKVFEGLGKERKREREAAAMAMATAAMWVEDLWFGDGFVRRLHLSVKYILSELVQLFTQRSASVI